MPPILIFRDLLTQIISLVKLYLSL